jgi:UDP-N-acetylglucosamine 2-epimerase (non-hydrolysing)
MQKLKVMTIVGTRPEIIRLSAVIKACDRFFDHTLVHTGQNWDHALSDIFFEELGLRRPDHFLGVVGSHLGETMGNIIARSYELMAANPPDAVLILGDTNSALSAISAKRLKVPIFHMEAGNRCFDQNVPEEINRKIVDHISDINLPYTEHSRRYLLAEGIRREHVFVTGSPLGEVLAEHAARIDASTILSTLELQPGEYFLVSAHREENVDIERNFTSLVETLDTVAETYGKPIIYSTHPRTRKRIEERGIKFHPLIRNATPFGFFDYNKLQRDAFCVLSDSGTLSEESAIVGFPAVLIRTSTERPEVLDKGTIVVAGITAREVLQAIELTRATHDAGPRTIPADYADLNVSLKVVKLIQSYAKLVDRFVWNKP